MILIGRLTHVRTNGCAQGVCHHGASQYQQTSKSIPRRATEASGKSYPSSVLPQKQKFLVMSQPKLRLSGRRKRAGSQVGTFGFEHSWALPLQIFMVLAVQHRPAEVAAFRRRPAGVATVRRRRTAGHTPDVPVGFHVNPRRLCVRASFHFLEVNWSRKMCSHRNWIGRAKISCFASKHEKLIPKTTSQQETSKFFS